MSLFLNFRNATLVKLLLLRQELEFDPLTRGLPRQANQRLLQLEDPALGRADEIRSRFTAQWARSLLSTRERK